MRSQSVSPTGTKVLWCVLVSALRCPESRVRRFGTISPLRRMLPPGEVLSKTRFASRTALKVIRHGFSRRFAPGADDANYQLAAKDRMRVPGQAGSSTLRKQARQRLVPARRPGASSQSTLPVGSCCLHFHVLISFQFPIANDTIGTAISPISLSLGIGSCRHFCRLVFSSFS